MGKTHAMWRGAQTSSSNWILFTDGDIFFRRDALRRTLAFAESTGCDHLVTLPTPIMKTFGERMMIAFFAMTGSMLFRPWKIKDPKARDFVGFGAFNLIRRSAYEAVGTYQALRMEVIDDLMLGEAVKRGGLKQNCVVGPELVKLRWAKGAFGTIGNLRKNLFSLLRFSWLLILLTSIAAAAYHLGPWIGLIFAPGWAKVGFVMAIAGIVLIYFGISQRFQLSAWYFFTQPLGGVLFVHAMVASALSSLSHGGVHWRGTTYSIAEIQAAKAKGSPAAHGGKLEARENRAGN
jgi:cellulose synthase/poly-beta-1,6-N-acetylglucosamine synthase-like glycosyltransferase